MAGRLQETTVGSVCKAFDGPHATPTKRSHGPVFLGITSLNKGRIDLAGSEHLSEEDFAKWTRRVTPRTGDVVFSYETKLGEAAIIPEGLRCCLGRRMALMRPDPAKADSRFLLYYYLGPEFQDVIRERTIHGSTVDRIALIEFPKFPLRLPPLREQKAIAHILGTLDDKIELNRRINATLEEMARALFKSWFVDFDPVRAKSEGRPTGLPQEIDALFPDSLQDSEVGAVPAGWVVRNLDEIAIYLNGLALQKYPSGDGPTLPVIKIAQLRKGATDGADQCNGDLPSEYIIKDGDVLFSWSGSLEVELWCGGPGALNQHLFKVSSDQYPQWFYYLWTLQHLPDFRQIAAGKATTMGHIQRGHLSAAQVLVPPRRLVDAMTETVAPMVNLIITNRVESRTLATLRDTLLPKLLSGELRVNDVGRAVGADF